jgi:hypothetical protein
LIVKGQRLACIAGSGFGESCIANVVPPSCLH